MNTFTKRILSSIVLLLIFYISFFNLINLFILIVLINFFVLNEFKKILNKIFIKRKFLFYLSFKVMLIYMVIFSLLIFVYVKISFDVHKFTIFYIVFLIAASDIGGYIFGKLIGGKKLTKISPNKTYSGAVGSFALSLTFGYLFFNFQVKFNVFDMELVFIILLISFLSQIGDLFISFLKRKAKIKDTGYILPGHGGILDRIDGLLLALPIGVVFF